MKKLLLIAIFVLASALSALATEITVSGVTIPNWTFGGSTAHIRISPDKSFVTSTGTTVLSGTSSGFYKTIDCTVAALVVTCPSVVLDSTTNSSVPTVRYTADLYDESNHVRARFLNAFRVPVTLGTTVTWEQLRIYNGAASPVLPVTYYTTEQVNALLAGKQDTLVSGTNIKTINGTSILGPGDIDLTTFDYALNFTKANLDHVFHGYFWEREKEFGSFYWEGWIYVRTGSEYILSSGYGGSHHILFGTQGTGTLLNITGNFQLVSGNASFTGNDHVRTGEWIHIAVGWDGKVVRTCTLGALSSEQSYTGVRKTSNDPSEGSLYVGGPANHSMANALIRQIRGFEGYTPDISLGCPVTKNFNTMLVGNGIGPMRSSNFLADYTRPVNIVDDLSQGFPNGNRQVVTNTVVAAGGITGNGNARSIVTMSGMTGSPLTVTIPVTTALTTASLIAAEFRTALRANATVNANFMIGGSGADITLTRQDPDDNDTTLNFTIENVTSTGITDDTTAVQTTAGKAGRMIRHDGTFVGNTGGPVYQKVTFAEPTVYTGTVTPTPVGAVLFDSFERLNRTLSWGATSLTLGTAPTGQTWTGDVGVIGETAFSFNDGNTKQIATVTCGSPNIDVRATRVVIAGNTGWGPVVRYTDANNYIYAQVFFGIVSIIEVVGGVTNVIDSDNVGFAGGEFRLVSNGTTVSLYLDGAGAPTSSGTTALAAGSRCGFYLTGPLTRVASVTAYPVP